MRHPEPEYLKEWWNSRQPMPRCCHTCDHYTEAGMCESYDMAPPAEFAAQKDACQRWLEMIPF